MKTNATRRDAGGHAERSFRLRLQGELARRCSANPHYSLRSFARDLATDHSTLGQLIRGKRRLTETTVRLLARRLGLEEAEAEVYVATERLLSAERASSEQAVRELAGATASLIADWYHWAILELVKLEGFRPESPWIARVLGITTDEVNVALQRLLRLGLLEMAGPDRWVDASGDVTASFEGFTREALRRMASETRRLWAAGLEEAPGASRDHSITTLAVGSRRLPEAIERIARFRASLVELLAGDEELDDVYRLEVHLYPVTNRNGPNHEREEDSDGPPGRPVADPVQEP